MGSGIDRRRFGLASGLALTAPGAAGARTSVKAGGLTPVELKVDGVRRPIGLESAAPALSWRLRGAGRGLRQTAYRIEVASSAAALAAGRADLWDSGRVASARNLSIAYAGPALISRQRCFWRVRVWDGQDREGSPSAVETWEMGLLTPVDWTAGWLAVENEISREDRAAGLHWIWDGSRPDATSRKFRLRFTAETAAEGELMIGARDQLIGVWLDGRALALPAFSKDAFGPEPVVVLPLTLAAGAHVLAVEARIKPGALLTAGGGLTALLRLRLADGRTRRLTADPAWKVVREAPADWVQPAFDDQAWASAVPAAGKFGEPWPPAPAMLMRRAFTVERPVVGARLYVTALGAYEARLNGKRVGDALLTPEWTDFRKRVLYRAFDVTGLVKTGPNLIGAVVGDGWYASHLAPAGRYGFGPAPRRFCAQLELTFADGGRQTIATDQAWRTATSPILSSEIYNGEVYDARREQPGWDRAGFDDTRWSAVEAAPAPPARLVGQVDAPIRAERTLKPVSVAHPVPGAVVYDFGQNFAGWARLKVKAPAGTRIELRFAEIIKADGQVDQANLRAAQATDAYVCKGDPAGETFEPHFTYHGFRYVQMTGHPGPPLADAVEGVVIHSALDFTGAFRIADPQIEKIWRNTVWSQRSNFVGIPTDCPQRDERLGWMGDANVFWDAAAFNMDVDAFTRRFAADMRDAQSPRGVFRDWAPISITLPESPSPGWADAGVVLPWTAWKRYGDTAIVNEQWSAMSRYSQFILDANPDFLWRARRGLDYGDWLALDAKAPGDPTTPKDLVATACWAHSTELMRQMAEATGRTDEARRLAELHGHIAAAFRQAFVHADGTIGNGSQTSYILPLRYGLLPDDQRRPAAERLAADIRRRGGLLSTGFLGTPNSLDVLAEAGYPQLVYDLLLRSDYPSWGYMVRKGATTMWERWNGDVGDTAMNSYNHYAFGAVSGFLFRRIAGLDPVAPGFAKVEVRPVLDRRVASAGADYDSAMGRFSVDWRWARGGGFSLDLTVPPNAEAEVHLPGDPQRTREGRRALARHPDVRLVRTGADTVVVSVGSGAYRFTAPA